METKHWEDQFKIQKEVEHIPDVTVDIELSMNKLFLNELVEDDDDSLRTQNIVVPPLNPLTLYAIALHKHANSISEMITLTEHNKNAEKVVLEMPQFHNPAAHNTMANLNFSSQDFDKADEVALCELSKTVVRQILTKSIATLFAHLGYETCQQSALYVLIDVLQEFFKKVCQHLNTATKEAQDASEFPSIIEKVLIEIGIGGVKGLNDYYQARVVKYVNVLEDRCKDLTEEYQTLLIPKSPSPVDKFSKVVRVKVEEEDIIEAENTEVHFSTIDGDVNFSILETGYQLLNSLEAEANLHSMTDGVEDISVTASPGIVPMTADDSCNLSPHNKKKKLK
ncbi:hypothetical protein Zmor_018990 [Zophobas morio]|uniref:STAGA complex 65 subunit gamma n=1 Tax=Zophobas morio TaxID=2755281 RepID=A0AA38ID71_9CUCU|nr:hypothetical protein Zmor_018990 [Zophobas morio]